MHNLENFYQTVDSIFTKNKAHLFDVSQPDTFNPRINAIAKIKQLNFDYHNQYKYFNFNFLNQAKFINQVQKSQYHKSLLTEQLVKLNAKNSLVFYNGMFLGELSNTKALENISIGSIKHLLTNQRDALNPMLLENTADNDIFSLLNRAMFVDGAYILIPNNTVIDEPIHIVNLTANFHDEPLLTNPKLLVSVGENSKASIIESNIGLKGAKNYLTNAKTDFIINENAKVQYLKIENESEHSQHFHNINFKLNKNADLTSFDLTTSAALSRTAITCDFNAVDSNFEAYGLYLLENTANAQHVINVNHNQPNCNSNQYYKGIMADRAIGGFNGNILVKPGALFSQSYMLNNNLLLSDNARANTAPKLEIYADEVQCKHGATSCELDDNEIYYLNSRGIDNTNAKKILSHAFAKSVINKAPKSFNEHILKFATNKLDHMLEDL